MNPTHQHNQLIEIAHATPWFMEALSVVRELKLASWCIGAGAVRNMVWDALHDYPAPSYLSDVDVAYFDAQALTPGGDFALQSQLSTMLPGVPWELTNQAAVHLWFEAEFGYAVEPLTSLEQGLAFWPEYATAIGLFLDHQNNIDIIAPYGLDDLFSMTIRRNPCVDLKTYRDRIANKNFVGRWPMVTIIEEYD